MKKKKHKKECGYAMQRQLANPQPFFSIKHQPLDEIWWLKGK